MFNHLNTPWQPLEDRTDVNMLGTPQVVTTFPPAPKGKDRFSVTYPPVAVCQIFCNQIFHTRLLLKDDDAEHRAYPSA